MLMNCTRKIDYPDGILVKTELDAVIGTQFNLVRTAGILKENTILFTFWYARVCVC